MPERADIEAAINDAMPEMESRFMWAASTGNHPDATAEGAVRTILEPFLDRVRDARGDDECTCAPTTGTDYEPHDPGCPKARSPQSNPYPWLTIYPDGHMECDMIGTTAVEADRRLVIMQELQAGRLKIAGGLGQ